MAEDRPESEPKRTQQTRPKKGKPIEIPVPKRKDWENLLGRAAKPLPGDQINDEKRDPKGPSSA